MGAKIQADEISSIIKERIDNFELNVDVSNKKNTNTNTIIKPFAKYHTKYKQKRK